MKAFSVRSNCIRAARATFGKTATAGLDFIVEGDRESGWTFRAVPAVNSVDLQTPVLMLPTTSPEFANLVRMAQVTHTGPQQPEQSNEDDMAKKASKTARRAAPKATAARNPARGGDAPKERMSAKFREALESAQKGKLPVAPDFTAETHSRWRGKLADLVALVKARDVKGLRAYPVEPLSSSRKALVRYRDLALIAIEAKRKAG